MPTLPRTSAPTWIAVALTLGLAGAAAPAAAREDATQEMFWVEAPSEPARGMLGSLADVTARVQPSILAVSVDRKDEPLTLSEGSPRRRTRRSEELASGFLISADGYALTLESTVRNARHVRVQLADGRRGEAKVVGRDGRSRLALLKLDIQGKFVPAVLGDSDSAAIGDWVIALGHPEERTWEGDWGVGVDRMATLAKGVLAGRQRRVPTAQVRMLQTDLVLVPGYAGAPLVDMNGRVVGILDPSLQPEASIGISFAVPIREAKQILRDLRASGKVRRGWLGVKIQSLTPALVREFGLKSPDGALVSDVLKRTPAEQAHIEQDDVIVEFAGSAIEESSDLTSAVAAMPPGTRVPLTVLRNGVRQNLEAVLGAPPEEPTPAPELPQVGEADDPLGFEADRLTPELAARYGLPEDARGLVVISVEPNSAADRAELAPGDLLREANRTPLESTADLDAALAKGSPLLRVQRGDTAFYTVLERERR